MSRILLIGYNPPPFEGHSKLEAANYRTWQFLQPLLDDGHTICLCADGLSTDDAQLSLSEDWPERLIYHAIPFRRWGWARELQRAHDAFEPDCIVAVNFSPCLYATKLCTNKPIWMDVYGDSLTIIQAACYRARSDRGIPTSIAFLRQVLQKGDIFSVCSTPQRHALVGELAMAGRLNRRTFGYEFVQVVLPGAPLMEVQATRQRERSLLTHYGMGKDDFVVLWCGGYNTWTDVETLFAALEWAMAQEPRIHYVSIGANAYEAPDNVYSHFLGMIEQSQYSKRFHMLGWRPWTEIANYYRESDVGINIDALHYETIYGTRTRLAEMMAADLPVITSLGCELSYLLWDRGAALTFEIGDWRGLSEQILALARDPGRRSDVAKTARSYASNELSFSTTTSPVRTWVREPRLAPDKIFPNFQEQLQRLEYQARAVVRQAIWRIAGLDK